MDTSKTTEVYEPTIVGIIALIEATIPKGYQWLLRSDEEGYFANIVKSDVNLLLREQREQFTNPMRDPDMRMALYGSFLSWQMKNSVKTIVSNATEVE